MKSIANTRFARVMSMLLVMMFMFTIVPASLVMADADYTMTLTADKTSYKAGETVALDVTISGLMNDVSLVQYSVVFDAAFVTTDASNARKPACFDADWFTLVKNEGGIGYISTPSAEVAGNALNVSIISTAGYTIDDGSDLYGAETAVAGKLLFTVNADIADVSKIFTLTNAKMAHYVNKVQTEKTVEAVQLKAEEPVVPGTPVVPDEPTYDTDYAMTLTADKTSYKAGETVALDVTISGLMNDVSLVQYSVVFDAAFVTTDASNARKPACFDADWFTLVKNEGGIGYISTPSAEVAGNALNVSIISTAGYTIDDGSDLYGAETAVAGKLLFTVNADIADVSKIFTLTNAKMAHYVNKVQTEKTVTAIQLKSTGSSEPEVPEVDEAVEAAIAAIAAIGEVVYTEECEALIAAAEAACKDLTSDQIAKVTNYADLQKAKDAYAELKAAADKEAADKAAADAVIALIAALDVKSLDDEAAVVAAREAYEALTDEQKALVTNASALEAAEAAIAELKKPVVPDEPDEPTYDTDYAMILTADKTSYKAGETVALDVTISGLMNDVSLVQYSVVFDAAFVTTDASNARKPACFDADWFTLVKNEGGIGYISTPSAEVAGNALNVSIISTAGYTIDDGSDLYGAETAVAGKLLFTVNADIADVSKIFTLTNAKMAHYVNKVQTEKTVTAVQLKGTGSDEPDEPDVPAVDEAVEAAIAAIAAIGEVVYTEECEALIAAAEAACKDLTSDQIAKVTNYADLQKAKDAYAELKAAADKEAADKAAADAVIALIAALKVESLDDEAAVVAAREAYEALADEQKALVTNAPALEAAEAAIAELKAAADKEAADRAAAAAVDALINALPAEITLDDEAAVVAARKAYEALEEDAAEYVANLAVLESAEATIAAIKKQNEENMQAAKDVEALINAIPEVTIKYVKDAEIAINAARAGYANLESMNIANLVDTAVYAKLTAAEQELAYVKAVIEEINAVIVAIDAIGEVTLDSEEAIVAAEEAYEALCKNNYEAADYVTNYNVLAAARNAYDRLVADKEAVEEVVALIEAIGEVTLDSEDAIIAAREAYDALKDTLKVDVDNYGMLTEAEATLENLKAVANVEDLIDAIGEVTMNNYKEALAKIVAAEKAYDALLEYYKDLVSNYEDLVAAREAYDAIIAELDQEEADMTAAAAVDALIEAIGEVTLDSEDAIAAAKAAYEELNDNAKDYVENFDILLEAIDTYNALVADEEAVAYVLELIAAIGKVEYTNECYARIKEAKVAYEELAEHLVDRIENADVIYEAEALYRLLESVDYVIELIDAIGDVEYTDECLAKIEEAEYAVKNLSDDQLEVIADKIAELEAKRAAYDALVPGVTVGENLGGYDGSTVVIVRDVTPAAGKTVFVGGLETFKVKVAGSDVYVLVTDSALTSYKVTYADGEAEELMLGDVNNDGYVTAADALLTLKKVVMDVEEFANDIRTFVKADVTGEANEGRITARDARAIAIAAATENYDAFKVFFGNTVVEDDDVPTATPEVA